MQSLPLDSPFRGGVPTAAGTPDALPLSIAEVIKRALDHNLGVLLEEERANGATGARTVALSGLLPHVGGSASGTRRKTSLEVFGFPLGDEFPRVVGPYNVFDARVFLSQNVFDMKAVNEFRAADHSRAATRHSLQSARDLVVLVAANAYLQVIATAARQDTARAQLGTATTLHQQAINLRAGGLVAGIDVVRAEVRMSTEHQRVTIATNEYEKAKLQLARVIGLPVGQPFTLSQEIPFVPIPEMTLDEALGRAYKARPDYLAALARVQAAEAARNAVKGEALPSLQFSADYGAVGLSTTLPTFSVLGELKVPIFEGGRTQGRLAQADAELRTRRAEADNVRATIYYDVRAAFLDLTATEEVLKTAARARELADLQLTQSRDRFAAGVASNIEVVESQEAVAEASEQYIAATYGFNVAKAMLARSLGAAEEAVVRLLGGPLLK
jgi:outer membrane protein TolC